MGNFAGNINFDYDLFISSIVNSLYRANREKFLPKIKTRYNVALLPDGHCMYTGALKAAGYKWLNQKGGKLFIIKSSTDGNGIFHYKKDIVFMGQCWKFEDVLKNKIKVNDLDFLDNSLFEEFSYPRILSQYESVMYFDIGAKTSKKRVLSLLSLLSVVGNVVLISELHKNLELNDCLCLDELTLNGKKDILLYDRFFSFAELKRKKIRIVGYSNSYQLDGNKKNTMGFASLVF